MESIFLCPTDFSRFLSSNSSLFLKVHNSIQTSPEMLAELEWMEDWNRGSIYLTEDKKHIQVNKAGSYLVYVQATFKLPCGNNTRDLRLQLNFHYPERTDQLAGAFDSRQLLLEEQQDAQLSFSVLVQMEVGNRLSVLARHRDLIDYDLKPVSTFLTIIRCSE
ncbi:hypothetical protein UPYG_G00277200 [Umbra pygmaea]|uniref:THD domain-containing protein n=1 Tax=Umbra pygmaea TaxID=75934 RepID=A0ABD0W463_UMBPY